eukprot:6458728-Prymnesium_polylepis.1
MARADYRRPRERPPPPDYGPTTRAARAGDLPELKALRAAGSPWNTEVLQAAAWAGHLHILEYALECACPWADDVYACGWQPIARAATQGGHSEIVRWARLKEEEVGRCATAQQDASEEEGASTAMPVDLV